MKNNVQVSSPESGVVRLFNAIIASPTTKIVLQHIKEVSRVAITAAAAALSQEIVKRLSTATPKQSSK